MKNVIEIDSIYESELITAISASLSAGKEIEKIREEGLKIKYKDNKKTDIVTNADYAAENIIKNVINERHAEDGIITEESTAIQEDSERMWVVDPIDGTTNFERGWTYYCISIALRSNNEYLVGVVHSPQRGLNRTYIACKDTPAYRFNGSERPLSLTEITVSNKSQLSNAICTCFLSESNEGRRRIEQDIIDELLEKEANYRETGSGALTISEIAEGVRDCRFDIVSEWDYAAASLILERAGGEVEEFPEDSIIATNNKLNKPFRKVVNSVIESHPTKHLQKH